MHYCWPLSSTSLSCHRQTEWCWASHLLCYKQRRTLSMINWWRSSVKLSWQHLQWST